MAARTSTVVLWLTFLAMAATTFIFSNYLFMHSHAAEIVVALALAEIVVAGILIWRAGILSFQTLILVAVFLLVHMGLGEWFLFFLAVMLTPGKVAP